MPKNPTSAESTQIAVLNVMLQSVKDAQTAMAIDIREIKNNKYVTQTDLQISRKEDKDDFAVKFQNLSDKIDAQIRVGMIAGSAVVIAIVGAIMKLILKI